MHACMHTRTRLQHGGILQTNHSADQLLHSLRKSVQDAITIDHTWRALICARVDIHGRKWSTSKCVGEYVSLIIVSVCGG